MDILIDIAVMIIGILFISAILTLPIIVAYKLTKKLISHNAEAKAKAFAKYCSQSTGTNTSAKVKAENADYEKWSVFWFFYAIIEMITLYFRDNIYVCVAKCGVIIYFAVFDSCSILIDGLNKAYSLVERGAEWYMQFCKEKSE